MYQQGPATLRGEASAACHDTNQKWSKFARLQDKVVPGIILLFALEIHIEEIMFKTHLENKFCMINPFDKQSRFRDI